MIRFGVRTPVRLLDPVRLLGAGVPAARATDVRAIQVGIPVRAGEGSRPLLPPVVNGVDAGAIVAGLVRLLHGHPLDVGAET
jgi:hypothetical protein